MKIKRYLAVALSAMIIANSVVPSFAAENGIGDEIQVEEFECITDVELPENDDLFEGYAEQLFYGSENIETFSVGNHSAGAALSGNEKIAYEVLVPVIKDIAAGDRESAVVSIGKSFTSSGVTYNAEIQVQFETGNKNFDLQSLIEALLMDYPYEMYWYNKTIKSSAQVWSSGENILQIIFTLYVSENYQADDNTTVNATNAALTKTAAEYAKSIVEENEEKSDYEKILAYKEEICSLVDYDHAAADTGNFTINNDPWQLIHVFDQDDSTNVVCEGYAKAFQYLCDMTSFETDVSCYCVTGVMTSSTGGGEHMWNIVTLDDKNYLVDVTNCDQGTIGYPDELFLCGTENGRVTEAYTFSVKSKNVVFEYDERTIAVWGTDVLTLATSNYNVNGENTDVTVPVLLEFSIDKGKASVGDKIKISIKIKEDNPESSITIYYKSPLQISNSIKLNKKDDSLVYEGYFIVDAKTELGIWKPDYIYLNDKNDNADIIYNSKSNSFMIGAIDLSTLNFEVLAQHVHSYSEQWTVDVEPTCKKEGSKSHHCMTCDSKIDVTVIPKTEHGYGEWNVDKEASCTEKGSKYKECTACGDTVTEDIPVADHDWKKEYTVDKEASCTEEGRKSIHCGNCSATKDVLLTEALGHKEVLDKAVAPTSTKSGLTEGSHCTVCGDILKEQIVIEALGNNNPFKDVEEGRFFYDPVLWAVKNNITTGTKPDKFSPDDPCTRAQVVTFLWRAIGRPEVANKSAFTDLREGAYYLDAVDWAVENKITTGTSPTKFSPEEVCTRAQIVTFLWRVAGCPKPSKESAFEDLREGAYYLDAVSWAVEEGITIGTSPTKFSPDEKCTRAQVVTFLYRYIY